MADNDLKDEWISDGLFWQIAASVLFQRLQTTPQRLSLEEASCRLMEFGSNIWKADAQRLSNDFEIEKAPAFVIFYIVIVVCEQNLYMNLKRLNNPYTYKMYLI